MVAPVFPALYFIHLFGPSKPKVAFILDLIMICGGCIMIFAIVSTIVLNVTYPKSAKDVNRYERGEMESNVCFFLIYRYFI